jgi:hypothetical protein
MFHQNAQLAYYQSYLHSFLANKLLQHLFTSSARRPYFPTHILRYSQHLECPPTQLDGDIEIENEKIASITEHKNAKVAYLVVPFCPTPTPSYPNPRPN